MNVANDVWSIKWWTLEGRWRRKRLKGGEWDEKGKNIMIMVLFFLDKRVYFENGILKIYKHFTQSFHHSFDTYSLEMEKAKEKYFFTVSSSSLSVYFSYF